MATPRDNPWVWGGVLVGAVGIALAVGVTLETGSEDGSGDDRQPRQASVPGCVFEPGQSQTYSVALRSEYYVNPNVLAGAPHLGNAEKGQRIIHGKMRWRVESPSSSQPTRWRIRATLQEEATGPHVMWLTVDERCRIHTLAASSQVPHDVRRRWQAVFALANVVAPPNDETRWQTEQVDGLGSHTANYKRDRLEIARWRSAFAIDRIPSAQALEVDVPTSKTVAGFATDGFWLDDLRAREAIVVRATGGNVFTDIETDLQLRRMPDDAGLAVDDGRQPDTSWELGEAIAASQPENERARQEVDGRSTRDVLEEFHQRLARGNRGEALALLVAHLRSSEGHPGELIESIAADEIVLADRKWAFLALEKAATPASRAALLDAVENRRLDERARATALTALPDVRNPNQGVLDALRAQREQATGSRRHTALLATGRLAANAHADASIRDAAQADVLEELEDASSPDARRRALAALGNTQNEQLADEIRPYADSDSAQVRAAAWQTLRRIGADPGPMEAMDAMEHEADATVERELSRSLRDASGAASDAEIERAISLLENPELSARERVVLVEFTGPHVETHEAARRALIDLFEREPAPAVLTAIGRYLDATDLPSR